MKKITFVLLAISFILTSCNPTQTALHQDVISPANLTTEQQDLINLLSVHSNEILLFDFNTVEAYENVEFWLEVYEYGELIE